MVLEGFDLHTKAFDSISVLENLIIFIEIILCLLVLVDNLKYSLGDFKTDILGLFYMLIACDSRELFQIHLIEFPLQYQ